MSPRTATTLCFRTAALGLSCALWLLPAHASAADSGSGTNSALGQMQQMLSDQADSINQQNQQNAQALQQAMQQVQQNQQNKDRKKQQQQAMALAAVGAGIAGMSCMMEMAAAQKEEDPALKQMMMSQALQQCGQAAQDLANAAKNDDGQQQLSQPAAPATAQLKAPKAPTSEPTMKPIQLPTGSAPATPDNTQLADNNTGQPTTAFDTPTDAPQSGLTDNSATFNADSTSTLKPIQNQGTTYDESAKPGDGSASGGVGSGSGAPTLLSSSGSTTTPNSKNAEDAAANAKAGGHGKGQEADGYAGAGGDVGTSKGASGGESGNSDPNINAMLAGLMGGGAGGPAGGGLGDSLYYGAPGGGKNGQRPPNIFQYANYRIKKLSKETAVTRAARKAKVRKADVSPFRGKHNAIAAVKP